MKTLEKSEMLERNKVGGLHWGAPGECLTDMQGMSCNTRLQGVYVAVGAPGASPGPHQSLLAVVNAA